MWYLYLDKSGDLGFDFVNKKPSKFFTVTILALRGIDTNRNFINAVKKTLKRKLNPKNKRKRIVCELKGTRTTFEIKNFFYKQISRLKFGIYSMTLNKKKVFYELTKNKSKVYNFIARQVLDQIPFEKNDGEKIYLIIDKSKNKPEIKDFNNYIRHQLEGRLNPKVQLDILHKRSCDNPGIQIADLFSYGIFQKYERGKTDWYNVFKKKIIFDKQYFK